jgi:hypothetical protein
MSPKRPFTFDENRLIIGEGPHDAAFFRELIKIRGLPTANVICVSDHTKVRGRDGFKEILKVIRNVPGFHRISDIIIATDSDNDADASFRYVCDLIANVPDPEPPESPHKYPVPTSPHLKAFGTPSITILMTPWHNRNGALETLCFDAAGRSKASAVACVDSFEKCSGTLMWAEQKRAKLRLRCLLASTYEKGPDIGFGMVWQTDPSLIPLNDTAFDQIESFLRSL